LLFGGVAGVDGEVGAGDVAGGFAGEEDDAAHEIRRVGHAAQAGAFVVLADEGFGVVVRLEAARREAVAADAAAAVVAGDEAGEFFKVTKQQAFAVQRARRARRPV